MSASRSIIVKLILLLCVVTTTVFIIYLNNIEYNLREPPPIDALCGIWVVDAYKAAWNGEKVEESRRQSGYLEIRQDGHFTLGDFPDYFVQFPPWRLFENIQSGAGDWWTGYNPGNHESYLRLDFKQVNGNPIDRKSGYLFFRRKGQDYFLWITIGDPDTEDYVVLRKKK
jgi:hypothetical protein